MTIEEKKYLGWQLESISFEAGLFAVNLARYSLRPEEAADLANRRVKARLTFVSEKVVLSNVCNGAGIAGIEQSDAGQGHVTFILRFTSESSFLEVTTSGITELLY